MSTNQVKRWRIYCNTESKYVDGYLSRNDGTPTTCFNNNGHTIDTSKTDLLEIIVNNYTYCVAKWKVHCDTEGIDVEGYLNDDYGTPTKCFNNDTHTISTTTKLEIIRNPKVQVIEETVPLQGRYRAETLKIESIQPNSTKVFDKIWSVDIAPLSVNMMVTDRHKGDSFIVDVSPDRIIGTITSGITAGVTNVIDVSTTVMDHIQVNFLCSITDGVHVDDLGTVLDIDYKNKKITVENTPTNNYLVASPTYFRMTVRYLGPHEIGDQGMLRLGDSKIGASHIPKGETARLTYINNSAIEKDFYILLEYLY